MTRKEANEWLAQLPAEIADFVNAPGGWGCG